MAQAHLQDVISYIIGVINSDSELTTLGLNDAYMYEAPERAVLPYVIGQKQAATHTYTMCKQAFNTHYLAIKCVDTGFDGGNRARTVMDRVVELIELQTPSLTDGGYVMTIKANNSYEYDEQETGNNNFYHCVVVFAVTIGQ